MARGPSYRLSPSAQHAVPSMLDISVTTSQLADATDTGAFSVVAWLVVGAATAASLFYMAQAFSEAKGAIERREEGEKSKQREDEAKEAARKQKIKDMFERL